MQWNAEGIFPKKMPLAQRLKSENIDIACIQETHLTEDRRFTIRGHETHSMPRKHRTKGGVMILTRNDITAEEFQVNTNEQSEIHGIKLKAEQHELVILNVYSPQDLQLLSTACKSQNKTALSLETSTVTQLAGDTLRMTDVVMG